MVDMNSFTLTKHDDELLAIIKPVKQNSEEHKLLALWAIDCLSRVLPLFESKYPNETTLKTAVATLQRWMHGEIKMWDARQYTYKVLALAKAMESEDRPYCQIVRAASHCLATCHVPTHAEGTAMYVVSAIQLIYKDCDDVIARMQDERAWQIHHLRALMRH